MEKIAAAALTMDESPAPCPCDCDCSDDSWIDVAWGHSIRTGTSETAATHPAASRRGIRGVAA